MFILAAEGFGLSRFARISEDSAVWKIADYDSWQTVGWHFRHADWVTASSSMGIAFWDLIQPAFMFMVGVAMPFSYARRTNFGESSRGRLFHALIRAIVLVLLGVFLYSLGQPRTNWIFPNVLAQIGLGYFFVYVLHHRPPAVQIAAIVAILGGYWALFFFNPPAENFDYTAVSASTEKGEIFEGRMAPWSKNSNVAFRFDQWLLPKLRSPVTEESEADTDETSQELNSGAEPQTSVTAIVKQWFFSNPDEYRYNRGGYTTLNFVPSIATALLGVLCGQLLISGRRPTSIVMTLLVSGGVCIAL